jgi:hypothetical protein
MIRLSIGGVQAMPYGVINNWGIYSIVGYPPCSLMVFLPPLYNQLSNKQGIGVENLFTCLISHKEICTKMGSNLGLIGGFNK